MPLWPPNAQALDSKIATVTGESKWITSSMTREYARRVRDDRRDSVGLTPS